MDGRIVVGSAFRSYTVDADGEIPQVAQLYLLSSQKLFAHAVHCHGEDSHDVRTLVHTAVAGDVLGKAVDVHHFSILCTGVGLLGGVHVHRIATHNDTVIYHSLLKLKVDN